MSVEEMNKKLEKILKDLDSAITDKSLVKIDNVIQNAKRFNKSVDGAMNNELINGIEEKIEKIVLDIKEVSDIDDKVKLVDIIEKLEEKKEPFEKVEKAVEQLNKITVNQEDLKNHKEQQKSDNTVKIDVIKENEKKLLTEMIYIEMTYIESMRRNDEAIKIINNIYKEAKNLEKLKKAKSPLLEEIINETKSNIRTMLSQLSDKGVDISKTNGFESDNNKLYKLNEEKEKLNKDNQNLLDRFKTDTSISKELKDRYHLDDKQLQDAEDIKKAYKQMEQTRQTYRSKLSILEAENKQIDKTIAMLENEKNIRTMVYNDDGTEKSNSYIAKKVLGSQECREQIQDELENQLFGKRWFKRTRAKYRYYTQMEKKGKLRAAWDTITHRTKNVKMLATEKKAVEMGRQYAQNATDQMMSRRNRFMETIKKEGRKEILNNPNITQDEIKYKVEERAYKSALGEDNANTR